MPSRQHLRLGPGCPPATPSDAREPGPPSALPLAPGAKSPRLQRCLRETCKPASHPQPCQQSPAPLRWGFCPTSKEPSPKRAVGWGSRIGVRVALRAPGRSRRAVLGRLCPGLPRAGAFPADSSAPSLVCCPEAGEAEHLCDRPGPGEAPHLLLKTRPKPAGFCARGMKEIRMEQSRDGISAPGSGSRGG